MAQTLRYGVFRLGQIWTVVDDDGRGTGYPDRETALGAARALKAMHRAFGSTVEVLLLKDGMVLEPDEESVS